MTYIPISVPREACCPWPHPPVLYLRKAGITSCGHQVWWASSLAVVRFLSTSPLFFHCPLLYHQAPLRHQCPWGTEALVGTHFPLCQTGNGSRSSVACGLVSYKFHSSSFSYIYREIPDIYMDTDINIDFQIPFQFHFHYRLLEDIKHSSLYYILGTCYFVYMSIYLLILISQFIPSFPLW